MTAWATGPGANANGGPGPCCPPESQSVSRDVARERAVSAGARLIGTPWAHHGREESSGLDQFGFLSHVYFGVTGRVREFCRGYPGPKSHSIASAAPGLVECVASARMLQRIHPTAAARGDLVAFASPHISPSFAIGVLVSPEGPGALLTTAPGRGVHVCELTPSGPFPPSLMVAAFTWGRG